jgi:hypothetical protein
MKAQAVFRLEATVYDDPARAGAGLYLQYTTSDSTGPGDIPNTFFPLEAPPVNFLGGTGAWVVLTWEITNAGFRSFQQGAADFRLGVTDGGRVCLDRVDLVFPEGTEEGVGPFKRGDCNQDETTNLTDGIFLLNFLFLGGPAPPAPGPVGPGVPCGPDPENSPSNLGCAEYNGC